MTQEKKLRVALCGVGDRLAYVAKTFQRLIPDFEIVGHADPNAERRQAVATDGLSFGAAHETFEDLLASYDLDLVMVGSPNSMHLEHIRVALAAGVTVWSEKPVVTTLEQTLDLLRLLRQHGEDKVLVGLVLRYSPLFRALLKAKHDGVFGDIVSIEASEHIAPEHGAFFMRDWRRDTTLSGGFMLEKCCHDLDLYQGLVGARPARVASFGGRSTFTSKNNDLEALPVYHERKSRWGGVQKVFDDNGGLIDHQTALIEYENGVNLCFHTNLNVPDEFRRFCVIGSRGMAEGDFVRNFFKVHDAPTSKMLHDERFEYEDGVSVHYGAEAAMAAEVAAHFYEGKSLPVSVIDALEAGLTAIMIDKARETREVIDLEETWRAFDEALGRPLDSAHGRSVA